MNEEILFSEQQKFKQIWLWILLIGLNGLFLYHVYEQYKISTNNLPELLLNTLLMFLLTLLFINLRLDTQIKKDGIYVRFFPFHFKYKFYAWSSFSKSYIRNYSAITEYGGWGLRHGLFGKGKAYTVSGNIGLQIEFKDNKKLLIGTNKQADFMEALSKATSNK